MGQNVVKSESVASAETLFSSDERTKLEYIFRTLCRPPQRGYCHLKDVMRSDSCLGYLSEDLRKNLYQFFLHVIPPNEKMNRDDREPKDVVYYDDFLVSCAHILKGSSSEKARLMCCLATGRFGQEVSYCEMLTALRRMLTAYMAFSRKSPEYSSWRFADINGEIATAFSSYLGQDLFFQGQAQCDTADSEPNSMSSEDDVERWLTRCPVLLNMIDMIFSTAFPIGSEEEYLRLRTMMIPLTQNAEWDKFNTILNVTNALVVNHAIPIELRSKWRFLFSTTVHGSSFTTFTGHIMNKGSTLIIIRDRDGHVFGAFAEEGWEHNGQFYGSNKTFLFSLNPIVDVYPSSGYNHHYQYFNQGQETIPNGIGFGGQFNYFGLWIDAEFGSGHSRAQPKNTTFNSPQLSAKENFEIDYMEVWGIGEEKKPTSEDEEDGVPKSILDKDPEAKAILSLIGRAPISEGLREEDP